MDPAGEYGNTTFGAGDTAAFGARLYVNTICGTPPVDSREANLFHPFEFVSSAADNRNVPPVAVLPAHLRANDVIGIDTRPDGHADEYPFATLNRPYGEVPAVVDPG